MPFLDPVCSDIGEIISRESAYFSVMLDEDLFRAPGDFIGKSSAEMTTLESVITGGRAPEPLLPMFIL